MRRFAAAPLALLVALVSLAAAVPAVAGGVDFLKTRLVSAPLAAEGATAWERAYMTAEDRADMAKANFVPKGALVRVVDTGLRIYHDTLDFDNFVQVVGKRLGGGTCLGMCEIVKNAYEKAKFVPGGGGGVTKGDLAKLILGMPVTIGGYASLRDLTKREPAAMKSAMDVAHLDNLRPESWLPWLRDAVVPVTGGETYRALVSRMRFGFPAKLSIQSALPVKERKIGPVGLPLPDMGGFSGHVLLAWKAIEFQGNALLFVYDPNDAYSADRRNVATCLALDRATGTLGLHPAGYAGRYPWVKDILCIDGVVGPWASQLKHAFGNLVGRIAETAGDAVDAVKEKVGDALDWTRDRAGDAARSLKKGWDAITRGFGKLF